MIYALYHVHASNIPRSLKYVCIDHYPRVSTVVNVPGRATHPCKSTLLTEMGGAPGMQCAAVHPGAWPGPRQPPWRPRASPLPPLPPPRPARARRSRLAQQGPSPAHARRPMQSGTRVHALPYTYHLLLHLSLQMSAGPRDGIVALCCWTGTGGRPPERQQCRNPAARVAEAYCDHSGSAAGVVVRPQCPDKLGRGIRNLACYPRMWWARA